MGLRALARRLPRVVLASALALPLLLLAGCGPKTGTLKGQVLLKGTPLPGGKIFLVSADGTGNPVSVDLDEQGNYVANKVPAGKVKIGVSNVHLQEAEKPPIGAGGPPTVGAGGVGGGKGGPPGVRGGPPSIPKDALDKMKQGKDVPTETGGGKAVGKYIPFDKKYHSPETSGLEVEVKGGDQTHNVDLK